MAHFKGLHEGLLLLVDRGFSRYDLWQAAVTTGAQLCWRTKSNVVLAVTTSLEDGSYLSVLRPPRGNPGEPGRRLSRRVHALASLPGARRSSDPAHHHHARPRPGTRARARRALRPAAGGGGERVRRAENPPAGRRVLRSKSPEMVIQEIYAHLLVYYAIRALINAAAEPEELDPDRVSFIDSLRVVRRRSPTRRPFPLTAWRTPSSRRPPKFCDG